MTEPVYGPCVTDFISASQLQSADPGEDGFELEFQTQDGGLYRLPISCKALTKLSEVLATLLQSPDFPSQSKPNERH